jgi:2-oxoglutarate dehydrogenase E2 component (dihydrolipoamide succinyltransferase)
MPVELKVPSVGESVVEVQIGRWLKQEGDAVAVDEPLVEIETDKVTQELPAPVAGKLSKVTKKQGDQASVGDVIGLLEEGAVAAGGPGASGGGDTGKAEAGDRRHKGEDAPRSVKKSPEATAQDKGAAATVTRQRDSEQIVAKPAPARVGNGEDVRVMPAAQRLLEQHGLSAGDVEATGPGGRLLKEDVERAVGARGAGADKPSPPSQPVPAASSSASRAGRDEEAVPMSPMRRRIAQRLVEAQQTAALLTTFNEVDMTEVMGSRGRYKEAFEKKHGVKLGFMSFFVKASIEALKAFPAVNAEIRGSNIVYKNYYDIGIAIGSGKGLVVPILRDADRLSMAGIEKAIGDFAQKVKENKLALDDLQGGTFTITNGGIFGSMMSTPIINPPQSGVLGMHAITERPMAIKGEVKIRPMMYLALTYDHRIVDGREAVSFLKLIKDLIEEPGRMLLEV